MAKRVFAILFLYILGILDLIGRLFRQTVALIIFIFVPFQSTVYLRVYLNILANVDNSSPARTLWRRRLHHVGLCLHLKSLHFLYLLLCPTQSPFDTFLHFDMIDYMIPKLAINGVVFLFVLLVAFFNERMFFHVQSQLIDQLVAVINSHSTQWFLSPSYKDKAISRLLSRIYATIFNLQSTFHLAIDILILCFESSLLWKVWPHLTVLSLLGHFLSFFSYLLFASNFFFISPLAFSTLLTALGMFHIKMYQIYRALAFLLKQRPLLHRNGVNLQETFLSTFTFFLRINAMYRWIFASFLLIALPLNALLSIVLLSKRIPAENVPFVVFLLYYTFLFIFIFHLAFAYPSRAIHRFGPLFQHTLVCKLPANGQTRSRIRLSHLIAAFHVPARNRYGFNYGNWGLVSLEAFLKYLLIYSKLAMALYRLLN